MKEKSRRLLRNQLCFAALAVLLFAAVVANIWAGSAGISVGDVFKILFTGAYRGEAAHTIVWDIRMPRLTAAALLGGALGVSGYLIQTYFRNPIASPFVLGISSGAKMVLAFVVVIAVNFGGSMGGVSMVLASFAGSLLATGFVLLCAGRTKNMAVLLVVGIMIGYICSAVTDLIITFAKDEQIVNLTYWSMGSFSGKEWGDVAVIACFVLAAFLGTLLLVKPISAFRLGEGYAQSMGMNVRLFRVLLLLLSSLLSACVVAYAGPVSFVGIAVPHLTKRMFSSSKPSLILPGSFLLGAVFCLVCDLVARTVFAPTELAISTVTAVLGAPVVIAMLLSRRRGEV
ncbi:MAG TPA: iron ABC transporter permease [Candidatus Borkfalkia faecipullorum]|uniref:Iron ABC transporter permease n=1 Tax=Candidatus Borkfalkia faecipullorum TaxID=2838510 RepID=A0A9D1V7G6_9FIRM|nr:iron ABC transporter permease [Candidatus Borkfalkia faecipullorum]